MLNLREGVEPVLKQILGVVCCLILLIIFLVIFGGFAFIDFAIKLMWIAFSFLITFACNNLNITFIVDKLNKFLSKYNLTVAETPKVRADGITFYNMVWRDERGNSVRLPQAEIRVDAYRVILDYFKKDREKSLFEDIKEITIRQPQLEFRLEPTAAAGLLPEKLAATEKTVYTNGNLDLEELQKLRVRLNVENGTLKISTGDQMLELDNICGLLVNEPNLKQEGGRELQRLFNLQLNCLYEGENISLRNHGAPDKFVLNGSKILLPKLWQAAKLWLPVIPGEAELLEGKLTDIRIALDTQHWQSLKLEELDLRLEECALECAGVRIENLEGHFHTEDVRTLDCRKLEFDLDEQHLRLKGSLALGEQPGSYHYNIKSSTNRFSWKNNFDLYILPGFGINGVLEIAKQKIKLLLQTDAESAVRLHTPQEQSATITALKGAFNFHKGILDFPGVECQLNGNPVKLEQGNMDFSTGNYETKAMAENLELTLLSDAPVQGRAFGELQLQGNWKEKKLSVDGSYAVEQLVYEKWQHLNLGASRLEGRLTWQKDELRLLDNRIYVGGKDFKVPSCRLEKGKLKIEFPSLTSALEEKKEQVKEQIKNFFGKILK